MDPGSEMGLSGSCDCSDQTLEPNRRPASVPGAEWEFGGPVLVRWHSRPAVVAFPHWVWQAPAMNTQYLTDEDGRKIAVVLPFQEFEELMEDVSDLAAVAERRGEERVSLAEVKQRLIADGLIPG